MHNLGTLCSFPKNIAFLLTDIFIDAPQLALLHSGERSSFVLPEAYHTFDWMLGVRFDSLAICQSQKIDAKQAFDNQRWYLGGLSYEFKNDTIGFNGHLKHPVGWEEYHFFEPQILFIAKENTLWGLGKLDLLKRYLEKGKFNALKIQNQNIVFKPFVTKDTYLKMVTSIKQDIYNGRFYELNYCIPFFSHSNLQNVAFTLERLQTIANMPFATFLKIGNKMVLGASPERFLRKEGNTLLSQPIKGTSQVYKDVQKNKQAANNLRHNIKERAENVMIVDLVRNDLAKTAIAGSVQVQHLFEVFQFQHIMQMISGVKSQLNPQFSGFDALVAAFPMGSMTGAPKIEVMEAINNYENYARGMYSGCIGYITPQGDFDFNVVIRSLQINNSMPYIEYHVGSAITWDSDPEAEYEECLLKGQQWKKLFKQ